MQNRCSRVLVTGGAGYVGSALVPRLLEEGFAVTVIDKYYFGHDVLEPVRGNKNLREVEGDIRDVATVADAVKGCDAVIHLACISNDPSFELDPGLGKSINYDCFRDLVQTCKKAGVKRFVYASSSSVYGVKDTENVHEGLPLEPLTDYSKFKAMCEDVLFEEREPGFVTLILRPATICGYSRRQRLDLTVNILTNHAFTNGRIRVFGGDQMRPNLHIDDMCDLYVQTLRWEDAQIDGKIFNAGFQNRTVTDIAQMVKSIIGQGREIEIVKEPSDDPRSYHISSEKIQRELGYAPKRTIEDAIRDVGEALKSGKLPNSMSDPKYFNIKTMQAELARTSQ